MTWTLVTGGAKNLGAHLALSLAREGKSVCIHYHTSKTEAERVARKIRDEGGEAKILFGDFTSEKTREEFLQKYRQACPETSAIIHNVGNFLVKPARETCLEEAYSLFESNFYAPFHITSALLPQIKKSKGSLLFLGIAGLASDRVETHAPIYHAAKGALCTLMKSLAKDLAPDLVRVNMVSPGYLENSMKREEAEDRLPMRRAGTFEEAARLILFLLSDAAGYITGQNVELAGGVRL